MVDVNHWEEFASQPCYQANYSRTVDNLSGGEHRLLETLMVLYSKANFILLDEPFTHISPIQVEDFKAVIRQQAKVKGIIITDHYYKNVMEVSDRLMLINNGYTEQISNTADLQRFGYIS